MTATKTVKDKKWYYKTYRIKSRDYMISLVFSKGTGGKPQTADVIDLQKDSYLEITTDKNGEGHYLVKNVTADIVQASTVQRWKRNNNHPIGTTLRVVVVFSVPLAQEYISIRAERL